MADDAPISVEEGLHEAWETSQAEKQGTLTGKVFTLFDAENIEYEYKGEDRQSWIGSVRIHGEDEERRVWFGGKVYNQVAWLLRKEQLPIVLTQVILDDHKGKPFELKIPDGVDLTPVERVEDGDAPAVEPAAVEPTVEPEAPKSGHPNLDALVQFCRDNKILTPKGNVNTPAILEKLGFPLPEGESAAKAFASYIKDVQKRLKKAKKPDSEEDAYAEVLQELVSAMALSKEEEKPADEPSPFGDD
jgi:hypothetical protein